MQIYALDHASRLVHARTAERGVVYICPECSKEVRTRSGRVRQPHFYHLDATSCVLHGKSLIHLQIQCALQSMLSPEEIQLERRFPRIARIADVVWPAQKLIFEVQVSPISSLEVRARNRDYAQEGYQVVWILHDRRFNRSRVSGAEVALRFSPHYFTNMDALGKGIFYDQHAHFRFKRRQTRSHRFPVRFKRLFPINPKQLPRHFPEERKRWPFSFEGDLFQKGTYWLPQAKTPLAWIRPLTRFLRLIHHLLLEKTTF
ncbi:competence protein CoiA [Chlamydiota bacterium]